MLGSHVTSFVTITRSQIQLKSEAPLNCFAQRCLGLITQFVISKVCLCHRAIGGPSLHECLGALNTKFIPREIDARQRGADGKGWSQRRRTLWAQPIEAQVELRTGGRQWQR